MKPLCSGEMIFFMIGANQSAKILDIILNLKLATAIGLYWPTVSASETFRINTISFALKLGKSQSFVKNSKTALITSSFTMS